jgi:hypothetical protein
MLRRHIIIAKRSRNIFQPADSTILPESPQTPALSDAHLRDRLFLNDPLSKIYFHKNIDKKHELYTKTVQSTDQ